MRRHVVVAEQAERQIRTVDRWWRENRLASPELFAEELASAFDTISTHPGVGRRYPDVSVRGVRRTLLRACRYHVYYVATDDDVVVLAVWNAVRGSGPRRGARTGVDASDCTRTARRALRAPTAVRAEFAYLLSCVSETSPGTP